MMPPTGNWRTVDERTRLQNELCSCLCFRRNNRRNKSESGVMYWTARAQNIFRQMRALKAAEKSAAIIRSANEIYASLQTAPAQDVE